MSYGHAGGSGCVKNPMGLEPFEATSLIGQKATIGSLVQFLKQFLNFNNVDCL